MKLLVGMTTLIAAVLGADVGYGTAGVGGAILFGIVLGGGGAILGELLGRTAGLLLHSWRIVLATVVLVLLTVAMWGVYL
jgi:hypothetical protein